MGPFAWTKWFYLAVQLNSGWPVDKFTRLKMHRKIRKLFYDGRTLIPCAVCGRKLFFEQSTLDHIEPRSKGGNYDALNLTITCTKCNTQRSNSDFWDYRHSTRASHRRGNKRAIIVFLPGTL